MASHHHHHEHGQATGWAEKNREHWEYVISCFDSDQKSLTALSKMAPTYNSPEKQREFGDLINKLTAFVLQNINWLGVPFLDPSTKFESQDTTKSVRVLDYACGPGTITAALSGYATEYVGIDISKNMVEEYNKRFANPTSSSENQSIQPEHLNAHAVVGDLLEPQGVPSHLEDEKYFNFDLAAVSGGFHHFEHVELATKRLAERLKPGGVFMIFDFLSHAPDDITDNPALHTIVHHGFDETRVRELFEGAGLEDVELKIMNERVKIQGKAYRTGFLAKGRKPK